MKDRVRVAWWEKVELYCERPCNQLEVFGLGLKRSGKPLRNSDHEKSDLGF